MYKILFCGLKNEYGKKKLGLSFEYQNFYEVLNRMEGVEASLFPIDEEIEQFGREEANNRLIKQVEEKKYDLLFCFLFTEELKKETISYITNKTSTKTFNWFADDHWRFPVFSKYWAGLFTAISTTDSQAMAKYKTLGIKNVIKTQWAANTHLYTPSNEALNPGIYNISFVGKNYGQRESYITSLQKAGLPAQGFGSGWEAGRVDFQKMLDIFSYSKINLNFNESSPWSLKSFAKSFAKLFISKELGKYKFTGFNLLNNFDSLLGSRRSQIKGRNFEVPACGGFLLTGDADNLSEYYIPDKEIVIYKNQNDLVEKTKYYFEHDTERKLIAEAGYKKTIQEHTYDKRFNQIFNFIKGL